MAKEHFTYLTYKYNIQYFMQIQYYENIDNRSAIIVIFVKHFIYVKYLHVFSNYDKFVFVD